MLLQDWVGTPKNWIIAEEELLTHKPESNEEMQIEEDKDLTESQERVEEVDGQPDQVAFDQEMAMPGPAHEPLPIQDDEQMQDSQMKDEDNRDEDEASDKPESGLHSFGNDAANCKNTSNMEEHGIVIEEHESKMEEQQIDHQILEEQADDKKVLEEQAS